jgi:hypothetical protein
MCSGTVEGKRTVYWEYNTNSAQPGLGVLLASWCSATTEQRAVWQWHWLDRC